MRSWRSSSPTDRSDVARRLSNARRFGSARMAKADSMRVYSRTGICLSRYFCAGPRHERVVELVDPPPGGLVREDGDGQRIGGMAAEQRLEAADLARVKI